MKKEYINPSFEIIIVESEKVLAESSAYDPRKFLGPASQAISAAVKAKMEVFGCIGKAE